jgi:hypothetical protein
MAEMDVGRGRVESGLYLKGPVLVHGPFELGEELLFADDFDSAPLHDFQLLCGIEHKKYDNTGPRFQSMEADNFPDADEKRRKLTHAVKIWYCVFKTPERGTPRQLVSTNGFDI